MHGRIPEAEPHQAPHSPPTDWPPYSPMAYAVRYQIDLVCMILQSWLAWTLSSLARKRQWSVMIHGTMWKSLQGDPLGCCRGVFITSSVESELDAKRLDVAGHGPILWDILFQDTFLWCETGACHIIKATAFFACIDSTEYFILCTYERGDGLNTWQIPK